MSVLSPSHPTRKALRRWHKLAGLCATLLLMVTGISGSLLAAKPLLLTWLFAAPLPPNYGIEQIALDLDHLALQIPSEQQGLVKAPNADEPYWQIITNEQRRLLLAPETLEVLADHHWLLPVLEWLRVFHTELLAGLWGEILLLVMSALTLFLLLSGLWLWWPARRRIKIRWLLPRRLHRKHLIQYHRHTGALCLPVVLTVVLSGTILIEQRVQRALFPATRTVSPPAAPEAAATPGSLPASALFKQAAAQVPNAWPSYLRIPSHDDPQFRSRFRLAGEWDPNGRTVVKVNGDGSIEPFKSADTLPMGKKLMKTLYPLHTAYGLNSLYQWLVIMSGLIACWMAGTGFVHWLQRRKAG
ncbi:putative iron-regulated membrane protein [Litorivivens lipolytica]|uniref:Putative iron-regulated membrane protein n=1 Tax=Litorivivens lipolytica TaxID=1524264 RepID=A0A7W4Z5G5_9GAMM|nr:PepSY-associated TM helix domain-containing protein [Litorivivens lipolytica]MBB3047193.1 putative iron-regulated membrane protein [Litorivivens lipolytica]